MTQEQNIIYSLVPKWMKRLPNRVGMPGFQTPCGLQYYLIINQDRLYIRGVPPARAKQLYLGDPDLIQKITDHFEKAERQWIP